MHRLKAETVEEDFIMDQQFKLKEAALASRLSPTKEVADIAALKQQLGGAACSSAVPRRCSERLKQKPLKRYDIYFNARPRKKMKRLEEIDVIEEKMLSSGSKGNCLLKRKASLETDNGHSNVKHSKSSRRAEESRSGTSNQKRNQKNATKRRSPLASKQKYLATVSLSKKNANSRKSAVDEEKKCPIQNLRKKRISVGSYEQNCAEKLREVDDTDEDWSIRSWQNKSMHVESAQSMLFSRFEQQTDTGFCKLGVELENIALKVTKTERQEDSFSVVDSLKMFSSCLRSCMTDEQAEAGGLCTEGEDCEGQQRPYHSQSRLVEGWLSDWEREDIDESRNPSSSTTSVDIATHYTCTLNKEWSFKDHEETEQQSRVLKDKESLPVECSAADEHLNILEGTTMEDVTTPAIAENVVVAQPEVISVQPIDAECSSSAITPLEALTGCQNSASEGPASAGTHEQQAVDGGSLNSGAPAFQHTGPAEEQSGIQRLHVELVVETPSEQASQDDQQYENFPSLSAQTGGLVLPTVKSEPAVSDNLKGILKRGPRLCEHACGCIGCVSGRSRAERASKFSQQQMRDIEGVSVMLLKELKNTRALIRSKLLADPNMEESSDLEEVRAVTSQALRTEEKAKSWIVRMARDCNRYCRIMDSKAEANLQRKIVFADEAGKQLNHIKLFNTKE